MPGDKAPRRSPLDKAAKQAPALAYRKPDGKRDRDWERRQRAKGKVTQVSYREISRDLNEQMKEVGAAHGLTVSEVAAAFLAYAMDAYEAGDLVLEGKK